MEDSSRSQGIFIQKSVFKNRKRKLNKFESSDVYEEPCGTASLRNNMCKQHWKHINDKILELELEWHTALINEIGDFIETSAYSLFECELVTHIGFLQTGLSTDENKKLFDSLQTKVTSGISPCLARLSSSMCPNIKVAFQTLGKQLIRNDIDVSRFMDDTFVSDPDESFCGLPGEVPKIPNSRYVSIHDLQQWYESLCPKYFKNPSVRNSPSWSQGSNSVRVRTPVIMLKKTDSCNYAVVSPCSPNTPNCKPLYRARKSLFGENIENEEISGTPKVRIKPMGNNFDENLKYKIGNCPVERDVRSTQNKKLYAMTDESPSPKASTPSHAKQGIIKNLIKCYDKKSCSDQGLISPILPFQDCGTPKRVSIANRPSDFCTPKRNSRHFLGTPKGDLYREVLSEAGTKPPPPIILIIEDVDYFQTNVMQEILQLMSCAKLPVILVVGVINCYENFSRFVPQQCSTTLVYKSFTTISSSQRFNDFYEQILFDDQFPLLLSGNIVKFLSDYFMFHHFSVTRVLQAYKLCLLEYYRTSKSILCTSEETFQRNVLSNISSRDLYETISNIEMQSSTKGKVSKTPTKKAGSGLDNSIEDSATLLLKKFHDTTTDWFAALQFLYCLSADLPNAPLGRNMRELYILCYDGLLFEEDEEGHSIIEKTLKLMTFLYQREFELRLKKAQTAVTKFLKDKNRNVTPGVSTLLEQIQTFIDRLGMVAEDEKRLLETSQKDSVKLLRKRNYTRAEFEEKYKKTLVQKSGNTVFHNLRKNIIDFVRKTVKVYLKPLPSHPHVQVFIFDNLQYVKQHFCASPHLKIHSALTLPVNFLQCTCCNSNVESIDSTLPDTSIVYKLYLEKTTKAIDLNELFEAFKFIVDEPAPPKSKKRQKNDEQILLRFRQAVAELQHVGFMFRSKRKVDEITRQTW